MAQENEDIDKFDKEEFLKALGQQIKKIRQEKGMKASDFAKKAFMERSHIARLEAGGTNPTATTLNVISKALGVELEDLFKGFRS
jgi:transcriptional regulator with XRE-family HTH domain